MTITAPTTAIATGQRARPWHRRSPIFALMAQLAPVLMLVGLFFLLPLLRAVWGSIDGAGFSFGRYAEIVTNPLYRQVLLRTFEVGAVVTLAAILLGYPVAYLLTVLPRRLAVLITICLLVPLFTAFLIRTYGWMSLLGRQGPANMLLQAFGLVDRPVRLLGTPLAVYIGMVHVLTPIAIFTMYATMAQLDRGLTAAARVLGANPVQAFLRVYLPMSLPGVISATVLVFIMAIGFFIAPALLGSPAETMIAQLIVTQITTLIDLKFGYALATVLLIVTIAALLLSNLFVPIEQMWSQARAAPAKAPLRRRAAGAARPLRWMMALAETVLDRLLCRPAWLMPLLLRGYAGAMILFMLAPLAVIVILSFSASPFLVFPPPGFSWQWYEKFFASEDWRAALSMSLRIAAIVASLAVITGGATAFALVRGAFAGKRALFILIIAPLLVPVVIVALCLYMAMADLGLLGSFTGLVIGHLLVAVPYALIILLGAVRGLDRNLEYAAATLGARPGLVFGKIVLPSLAPGLVTAWVMAFLHSFDELLVTLFLLGRQTPTLPIKMWSDIRMQFDPVISAASSTIVAAVALVILASQLRNLRVPKASARPV